MIIEKKVNIFRYFDNPDVLYGVIKVKVVIREITWTDLCKYISYTVVYEDELKFKIIGIIVRLSNLSYFLLNKIIVECYKPFDHDKIKSFLNCFSLNIFLI